MADNSDTGLLREIDEELRQEHYASLWKRFGNYVIAAIVMLIVGVAGYKTWQSYDLSQRNDAGVRFAAAVSQAEQGNADQAFDQFNVLINDAPSGYKLMAQFRAAGVLVEQGKNELAALAYDEISADSSVNKEYRDLAILLAVSNRLDQGSPQELSAILAPLTVADNPLRYSALEASAILALRNNDKLAAKDILNQLSEEPNTPVGISSRALELLAALNAQ